MLAGEKIFLQQNICGKLIDWITTPVHASTFRTIHGVYSWSSLYESESGRLLSRLEHVGSLFVYSPITSQTVE